LNREVLVACRKGGTGMFGSPTRKRKTVRNRELPNRAEGPKGGGKPRKGCHLHRRKGLRIHYEGKGRNSSGGNGKKPSDFHCHNLSRAALLRKKKGVEGRADSKSRIIYNEKTLADVGEGGKVAGLSHSSNSNCLKD